MAKNGYSRKGFFGETIHYDANGNKVGESRKNFWGGYDHYDASGHKTGTSREGFFGGMNHYDNSGNKTGHSHQGFWGQTNHYDSNGHMAFKIKTSKKTEEIISRLEMSHNLPCYTLVKLAMALSLRCEKPLEESDFRTNTLGRELNRQTITGDADTLYKCLMELYSQKHLTDEEFFPNHVKAHIDRGIILLEQEARYGDDLLIHLTELEKGI